MKKEFLKSRKIQNKILFLIFNDRNKTEKDLSEIFKRYINISYVFKFDLPKDFRMLLF